MDTTPHWIASADLPHFPALDRDLEVDAVVVGAGITGITAAWLLKRAGRTVALLERARCASIDTGHTTAHITAVTDERLHTLISTHGRNAARAVWDAGCAAMDQIVAAIRESGAECDFRWVTGYLHASLDRGDNARDTEELQREADAARELEIPAQPSARVPYLDLPGLRFPHQALFHPRKYLAALVAAIPGNGSHVFEQTAVDDVDETLVVKCGGHRVRCRHVFLATHNPLTGKTGTMRAALFQTKLALYTSYAVGAKVPAAVVPEALYWDLSDPYFYLRVERHGDHDYAIFGGGDHKTGQVSDTQEVFERLERRLIALIPGAQVDHRWSGQVIASDDGLPFIGETADHQYVATGFAGNGMTFGTLGAMIVSDAILGRKNPWARLLDARRTKVRGAVRTYVSENKDYPYYLLRDWIGGADEESLDTVPAGGGRVLKLGGRKVAAHRDADGTVTLCSPVCTHLGCIVTWNNAEQTWDCPCHGSRFAPTGEVISGPAAQPLERLPESVGAKS